MMMMKKFEQGEYVYIPSNVLLFRFDMDELPDGDFNECKKTKDPHHLMFINPINEEWVRVFYNGNLWAVKKENVYERRVKK